MQHEGGGLCIFLYFLVKCHKDKTKNAENIEVIEVMEIQEKPLDNSLIFNVVCLLRR